MRKNQVPVSPLPDGVFKKFFTKMKIKANKNFDFSTTKKKFLKIWGKFFFSVFRGIKNFCFTPEKFKFLFGLKLVLVKVLPLDLFWKYANSESILSYFAISGQGFLREIIKFQLAYFPKEFLKNSFAKMKIKAN